MSFLDPGLGPLYFLLKKDGIGTRKINPIRSGGVRGGFLGWDLHILQLHLDINEQTRVIKGS